jgi:hypothetical protein
MSRLEGLLQQCTVQLKTPGKGWGTGFFVAPRLILTCAHVTHAARGEPIQVRWKNHGSFTEAIVEAEATNIDLVLLQLSPGTTFEHPCVLLDTDVQASDTLSMFGYPDQDFPNGCPVTVTCEGETGDSPPYLKFKLGQVRPGMSGSPLLNQRTRKVCGVVQFTLDRTSNLGGGAIPASTILQQFPSLLGLQQRFHERNRVWITHLPNNAIPNKSLCNLPQPDYPEFIGREQEIRSLMEFLSPHKRRYVTTVYGIGGVGKTALVLQAAHLCWNHKHNPSSPYPRFDAIIFTSAKSTNLTPSGYLKRPLRESTLSDIFLAIARVLDDQTITQEVNSEKQLRSVYESLGRQRTLLIVDNMETMKERAKKEVLAFLEELPENCKAIITSRKRLSLYSDISLEELPQSASLQLIQQQAIEKKLKISPEQAMKLYGRFGGIPVALIYAVGQWAMGHHPERSRSRHNVPTDLARYCFNFSFKLLSEPARRLLYALCIFQGAPTQEAWMAVSGFAEDTEFTEESIGELKVLSLVNEVEEECNDQDTRNDPLPNQLTTITRYRVLALTREYVLAKLTADQSGFEQAARKRWVCWYLDFAQQYGGEDWAGWRSKYDHLEQEWTNLRSVLQWCASRERYEDVKTLWQRIDNYVDLYGHWQDRLNWLGWLIQSAPQWIDLPTYIHALSEKGWTMILMGGHHQQEAEQILLEAWSLRERAPAEVQVHLANHLAVLQIAQGHYDDALNWLQQEEALLNHTHWKGRRYTRQRVQIQYYRAEVYYYQGDYEKAQDLFQQVFEKGKTISWQRFANYAQNYLAEVAIAQDDLEKAESLIIVGKLEAESNNEKRRIVHYQASHARLDLKLGQLEQSKNRAIAALEFFRTEGMSKDVSEMQQLLEQIKRQLPQE